MCELYRLVEEFMLLANTTTAEFIYTAFPDVALLRHHSPPDRRKLEEVLQVCDARGVAVDASR